MAITAWRIAVWRPRLRSRSDDPSYDNQITMRQIVLDTETTGLSTEQGHRIIEIGCVEMVNRRLTGRDFHRFLNPDREIDAGAEAVHGISRADLETEPRFHEVVDDLLEFIRDAELVIHNAEFDMRFINAELKSLGRDAVPMDRAVDTVRLAREKFPGASASLDALCKRFNIDNSSRTLHGALLDAQLLAEVYLELIGGRQPGFERGAAAPVARAAAVTGGAPRAPRAHAPSAEERAAHERFLEKIVDPLWDA